MKLDVDRSLFIGCKVESALRDALNAVPADERHYFEDPNATYLRICRLRDENWIGKVVDAGMPLTQLESVQKNILSILARLAPSMHHPAEALRVYAISSADAGALEA